MEHSDWRVLRIKDIGYVVTGRTPSKYHPEHFGTFLPFITPTDMADRRIIERPSRFLSKEGAEAFERVIVPQGVAVSCIGWQMGKSLLIDRVAATNQQINTIVPNEQMVDVLYLYYSMLNRRAEIFRLGAGGSRTPIVNKSTFEQLSIILPPLAEQRAIAHILGTLDDKIELNRRMNETLEAMAQAHFKSWFVDFDPVRAKAEGRQLVGMDAETAALFPGCLIVSTLGEIPRGWKIGTLRDCCFRVENGGTPRRNEPRYWLPPSIPWLTSAEVRQGFIVSVENAISEEGLANSSAKLWPQGATVVALYGATAGQVSYLATQACANQACCGLLPLNSFSSYMYLHARRSTTKLETLARGSAQQNLSQEIVAELPTLLPDQELVARFHELVQPLFEHIASNLRQSKTLASMRDTILPKLLSGDIRVKEAERVVSATV